METTPAHKLFTYKELQDHQQAGTWPLADSTLLSTKYADRWEMSKRLHDTVDLDFFKKHNTRHELEEWGDDVIPNKIYSNLLLKYLKSLNIICTRSHLISSLCYVLNLTFCFFN